MLLIIANKNYSSWSMRPWVIMQHFNIPFEEQTVLLKKHDSVNKIVEYSNNPIGTVPILINDNIDSTNSKALVIQDSLAICEYLADSYLHLNLWPQNKNDRAKARSIVAQMHSGFHALRQTYNMNIKRTAKPNDQILRENNPNLDADIKRIEQIWTELLISNNKQPYLFGEFSIADAFFAPVVTRFYSYGAEINNTCKEYMHTIINTSAVKKWVELALKETEVILAYEV